MDDHGIIPRDIKIGQVDGKKEIIGFDIRAQKQGTLFPKLQRRLGKITRAIEKYSLLTQAGAANVSVPVEYREHGAVLEDAGTVVGRRRFCGYVVLLGDVNFIIQ